MLMSYPIQDDSRMNLKFNVPLKMLVQTDGENANQYYNWNWGSFEPYSFMREVIKMAEEGTRVGDDRYVALAKFLEHIIFTNLRLLLVMYPIQTP